VEKTTESIINRLSISLQRPAIRDADMTSLVAYSRPKARASCDGDLISTVFDVIMPHCISCSVNNALLCRQGSAVRHR